MNVKVSVTEKGKKEYQDFLGRFKNVKGSYVSVGVQEGAGSYPNGVSVVEVALWNEFGTRYAPERSFMRSSIDENVGLINQWREEVLESVTTGKITVPRALEILGFRVKTLIENKIGSNVPPPNAPSVVEKKQREGKPQRTLMDNLLLQRSITYKVVVK